MPIDESTIVQIFYKMLKARFFEEKAMLLKKEGFIEAELYLSAGQEAAAAAVCALSADDAVFASHRCLTAAVAADTDAAGLFYELMGIKQGLCAGHSGGSGYADNTVNFYGASALAGSGFGKAVGAALSFKIQGRGSMALCFAGDGAAATGEFYEALNEAAVLKVPVIFFIENNCYAADVPVTALSGTADIADRAKGFDIPGIIADGNNAPEVYEAVKKAREYAREKSSPVIVEAKTYRLAGFNTADKQAYRSSAEVDEWRGYDCIDIMADYMLERHIGNYDDLLMLREKAKGEIDAAADDAVNMSKVYKNDSPEAAE